MTNVDDQYIPIYSNLIYDIYNAKYVSSFKSSKMIKLFKNEQGLKWIEVISSQELFYMSIAELLSDKRKHYFLF